MATRRLINFNAAVRELRSERDMCSPFVVGGCFCRIAIMRAAVRRARGLRASGLAWTRRMAVALRAVWQEAKREPALAVARVAR